MAGPPRSNAKTRIAIQVAASAPLKIRKAIDVRRRARLPATPRSATSGGPNRTQTRFTPGWYGPPSGSREPWVGSRGGHRPRRSTRRRRPSATPVARGDRQAAAGLRRRRRPAARLGGLDRVRPRGDARPAGLGARADRRGRHGATDPQHVRARRDRAVRATVAHAGAFRRPGSATGGSSPTSASRPRSRTRSPHRAVRRRRRRSARRSRQDGGATSSGRSRSSPSARWCCSVRSRDGAASTAVGR